MIEHWNERYSETEYAYGLEPNVFMAGQLKNLPAGKILFACEGEGRNAVFAAKSGWETFAFDQSVEGCKKAMMLAEKANVTIDYQIADALIIDYPAASFDVIALIYAHFPSNIRQILHQKFTDWLKPGGFLILEAFNPAQLQFSSGGPKDISMLYTKEMLSSDFINLKTEYLKTMKIKLNEGKYHQGIAEVIRYSGIKNK